MTKDYYKVLIIPRDADEDVIKQAYRDLAKQYHPDRTADLGPELRELAHKKMMEINEAFQVLSNPETRKEHDAELSKTEATAAPSPAPATPAAGAPTGGRAPGAKSDFWRNIERIEAERRAADEAAQAAEAVKAAEPPAEPEKVKPRSEASARAARNVLLDFVDKFYRAVMQSGPRWTVDAPKGWTWVLDSGAWRKSYTVGYCHVDNLGTMGLRRTLSRIQAVMEQKKGVLKQSHFFFLVSYDRLMDTPQVVEGCKSWALEGRPEAQRLFALVDAVSLAIQLFGIPSDDRMRSILKLLGPRK